MSKSILPKVIVIRHELLRIFTEVDVGDEEVEEIVKNARYRLSTLFDNECGSDERKVLTTLNSYKSIVLEFNKFINGNLGDYLLIVRAEDLIKYLDDILNELAKYIITKENK